MRCAGLSAVSVCESRGGSRRCQRRAGARARGDASRTREPRGGIPVENVRAEVARVDRTRPTHDGESIESHLIARIRTHRAGWTALRARIGPVRGAHTHQPDAWFTPPRSFKNGRSRRAPESRACTIRELVGDESAIQSPRPTPKVAFSSVADPEAPLSAAPRFDAVFDPRRRSKKASRRRADEEYPIVDVYGAQSSPISTTRYAVWKYL